MRGLLTAFVAVIGATVASAQVPPEKVPGTMRPGPGLQVELFAHEPMLINPTAIDVDHKGRVWVCEGVNYRTVLRKRPLNQKEGDRIQILIDETGTGKATKAVTFFQGTELLSPLGICVIPQPDMKSLRVLVAQSPDILEFWDRDGDLKADGPPTKFLTGFGGIDHDHGVHGLSIGPDGRLYFTVGDQGVKDLKSKDGKGKSWTTNKTDCQAGTVWRYSLDGTNLELIAHNFRNNYECCVDSFGEIWLSDNDDDGNQQTRICHVLPGGNYGYWPRGPGQSHWHEEQPGIVHKTLRTGFGSPTGICFYEGTLLPKQYQGDLIHCDAGPREVRYFKRIPKGAGYELEKTIMLTSTDTWFRPSAVRVAPDGSVFVADWYDPGVGGHGMGDTTRGRIFRLTPAGHKGYAIPANDLLNAKESIQAIKNACSPYREVALLQLTQRKNKEMRMDLALIEAVWKEPNDFVKARIVHLILRNGEIPGRLFDSMNDDMKRLWMPFMSRCSTLYPRLFAVQRSLMQREPINDDLGVELKKQLAATKREMSLQFSSLEINKNTIDYYYLLASEYNGSDRTYLSALNIACGTDPARRDAILADFEKHFPEWNDKVADLVWELRPKSMLPRMNQLLTDSKLTPKQRARIVDILSSSDDPETGKTILGLLTGKHPAEVKARAVENLKLFLPAKWNALAKSDEVKTVARKLLDSDSRDELIVGLKLCAVAQDASAIDAIKRVWSEAKDAGTRAEAAQALGRISDVKAVDALGEMVVGAAFGQFDATPSILALGQQVTGRGESPAAKKALSLLQELITDPKLNDPKVLPWRRAALDALTISRTGTGWLLKLKRDGKFPPELVTEAGILLRNSAFQGEHSQAHQLFPVEVKLDFAKLPSLAELAKRKGDPARGKAVFQASFSNDAQCMKCHKVDGAGGDIGPELSAIGLKGSVENLFESVLFPSRAISDQFAAWKVETADGQIITGLLVKESEGSITIRDANGKDTVIDAKSIESRKKSLVSLMPDDIAKSLTEEELVNLVAYLATLKTGTPPK